MAESVWDYPRPPVVEVSHRRARVVLAGVTLADSERAMRVLETSQAPAIYFPPGDVAMECLREARGRSLCEWKGMASYFDAVASGRTSESACWTYLDPDPRYAELRDHVAFYPQRVDECRLGEERVEPNQGDFYGGWITSDIEGPFKGGPHSARLVSSPDRPTPSAELAPLQWQDGSLLILDQRALPTSERWFRCETPAEVAEAIQTLAIRGAPAIGLAAAYGCALAFDGGERCATESRVVFDEAARVLTATRPTAVNLAWALERAREVFEGAESAGSDIGDALLGLAHRLVRNEVEAERRLAAHATERFFEPGHRALTHCNAGPLATGGHGTAGGVLRTAFDNGRLSEVWVCETRPLLQGARITAWELARFGIPHRLITDSSAGALMARGVVDRVVVGADRVAVNGDVANKIGTYPLAVLAARHEIPFIVAAPLSTLDPATPDGAAIPLEERDPQEVTTPLGVPATPPGTSALNLAFDVTPADLVTAIVTEVGVLEAPFEEAIRGALG